MDISSCNMAAVVHHSCPTLCDPMDLAYPSPLSLGFFSQEHWSSLPFPSPGDLSNPGIEPMSLAVQAVSCRAGGFFFTD